MKYAIRAVKYFLYFSLLTTLVLFVFARLGLVESDVNAMFRDGYNSVWKIAVVFALISAIYPRFGFGTRTVAAQGGLTQNRQAVLDFFDKRGYILEKEENDTMCFRLKKTSGRITRMMEDRITLSPDLPGFRMEGIQKDLLRLDSGLQELFGNQQ